MHDNSNRKVYTAVVFIISLLIFIFSLVPGAFFVSTVNLSGTAGDPNAPSDPSVIEPINLTVYDSSISIVAGIVSILAAVYGIQLTRSEFAKLRAAQIDSDMQRKEIEKLRLELELEKQKEEKRKKRAAKQRKQIKTKKQTG